MQRVRFHVSPSGFTLWFHPLVSRKECPISQTHFVAKLSFLSSFFPLSSSLFSSPPLPSLPGNGPRGPETVGQLFAASDAQIDRKFKGRSIPGERRGQSCPQPNRQCHSKPRSGGTGAVVEKRPHQTRRVFRTRLGGVGRGKV